MVFAAYTTASGGKTDSGVLFSATNKKNKKLVKLIWIKYQYQQCNTNFQRLDWENNGQEPVERHQDESVDGDKHGGVDEKLKIKSY